MHRHARVVLTLLAAVIQPFAAHAQSLVHDWSRGFGDADYQYGIDVDVDAAGNVVTVGDYFGTMNFGGGPLTSAGDLDVYVAKFDAAGNHLWSVRFGDADRQLAKSVAIDDSDGSIVVVGIFQGSIDFGGGPLVSAGGFDAFMVKFDAFGNYDWSRSYGDAGDQLAYAVAVDTEKYVVLTGPFTNKVDFGGGALTSAGSNDIYIARFDLNGDLQWADRYGDASAQATYSLATDADGNILATGGFGGTLDFGGAPLVSAGLWDAFVVKLDRGGGHMWSARFGDGLDQYGIGVTADSQGNVLLVGDFEGTVDFGGGAISSAGWFDAFLVKLDGSGGHLWSQGFGEGNGQFTGGVAVDADDNVSMAGYFEVAIDLGGGPIAGVGWTDGYAARFDAAGNHLWSDGFGAALENQYGIACVTDASGGLVVIGYGSGDFDFGGGTIPSGGAEDAYLVKYSTPAPDIQAIVDVPGDQGGWARLFFTRALSDEVGASPYPVINYHVFRRVDSPALVARVLNEGREAAPSPELPATLGGAPVLTLEGRAFWRAAAGEKNARASSASAGPSFVVWEAVATVPARQQPFYIGLVPTLADSGAVVQHSVYFVMAQTTTPWVYYDSAPDSGYSVDNLSPATPLGLAGTPVVSPAALTLAWDPNGENDLSHYAVYRGNTIGFVPGPGNRIGTPASPLFVDDDWEWDSGFYYKVAALDIHGNESGHAVLSPDEVTGVGVGAAPSASFLAQNHPNPFSASTHIAFGLREDADVRIRIYDVAGRLVRDLVDGRYAADRHLVSWDGRDDAGRAVAGGVYFYRLDAGAFVETRKLLLMR